MKVVIQRSMKSTVTVDNKITGKIDKGLVLLVGFSIDDSKEKIKPMVEKIIKLRIFNDENNKMNKSILDIKGKILSVSQFTLYADTDKGNRPSYVKALDFEKAKKLYDEFNFELNKYVPVETGVFGADMSVNIENDGPVTIIIER